MRLTLAGRGFQTSISLITQHHVAEQSGAQGCQASIREIDGLRNPGKGMHSWLLVEGKHLEGRLQDAQPNADARD